MEYTPTHDGILILISWVLWIAARTKAIHRDLQRDPICSECLTLWRDFTQSARASDSMLERRRLRDSPRSLRALRQTKLLFLLLVNFSGWGSYHNMASQLLLEGCVDAWCFFSAELFDWRNIRITSKLRGLRLQPIISSSELLSWCTNPWRSPQHWRVRLVSHSLNSTPYHEIDWNVGNFSKT